MPGGPTGLNFQTVYNYDTLDNLTTITQGSQHRFFMYDSLKRLIGSRSPEQDIAIGLNLADPITGNTSWSMGYQYDSNNNLTQKTDARGVVSTYGYDTLNRNTTIDYSDTASINPDVTRIYDGADKGKNERRPGLTTRRKISLTVVQHKSRLRHSSPTTIVSRYVRLSLQARVNGIRKSFKRVNQGRTVH